MEEVLAGRSKSKKKTSGTLAVRPSATEFKEFEAAGVKVGVDPRAMERLVARLQGRSLSAKGGRLKLSDQELLALIDDGLARAFQFLDDFALGQATARDVAVTVGVLIDKRRLLRGEPTAITKLQDMRKLDDLVEIFRKEAERRRKLVDVTPEVAEAGP